MKKFEIFTLLFIVIIAFVLRLYKINSPIADWHSWRQADTAAVARNFIKEGYTPFVPTFDDMSMQTNGLDNPNRFRFVEFPIYNSLIYFTWLLTGVNTTYARLVTVIISLGSTALLYFIVRRLSGQPTAAVASFLFAVLPYNVFYSSTILPAPLMVFATMGLYLSFLKWLENEKILFLVLSIVFANLAILTWPIALFFMLPLCILVWQSYGSKLLTKPKLWIFALLSLVPFLAWRIWILTYPAGIPNWQFLLNEGNIRFKGSFFRWLIAERMGKLILTVGGFSLFILGMIQRPQVREKYFYLSWLTAVLVYFTVFASGNVRHDYYQIPAVPILVIFVAKGVVFLSNPPKQYFVRLLGPILAISLLVITLAFGFFEVRGYYWINNPQIVSAGLAADKILPKDATVIAPYNGDTAFLYQTNRHGYPVVDRPLEEFIQQGTKYLVSVDVFDAGIQTLAQNCKVIDKTADYVIIEISKDCLG